ncbi:MAG: lysine--tRNA ligase, partial [Fidelibacterota bacterium]
MSDEHKSLQQIIDFRLEKLKKLKDDGVNPYPTKYEPTHRSESIKTDYDELEGKTVKVAGRVMAIRKMGKASFAQIMDSEGRIQFFIKRDDVGEKSYSHFKLLDIGDYVGVEGYVFTTKTGEISVHTDAITVLAKSIRPLPVVKEKDGETFDAFTDKEQRYRNRHLDLILNPEVKETFIKRAAIIKTIRNFLDDLGFLEVETPVLQPLYGGANARPFTTHHNTLDQTLYLRIADELYLKRLIIGGIDRVYELSKDFRNEGMDRSHNPEFTMLEFYWAYADYEDCMDLVEKIFREAAEMVGALQVDWGGMDIDLSKPFIRK